MPFGNIRESRALLWNAEQRLVAYLVPKVPKMFNGINLTLATILWCGLVILAYKLATTNIHWLWLASAAVVAQYVTDLLDGAVGRFRNSGLIRWGYYMDHLLDFIFLTSVSLGVAALAPTRGGLIMAVGCMLVLIAFMMHAFLLARASDTFRISESIFGPTELRIFILLLNIAIIYFGRWIINWWAPIFFTITALVFVTYVIRAHRELLAKDRRPTE